MSLANSRERLNVEPGHLRPPGNRCEREPVAVDAPPAHEHLPALDRNPGVPNEADAVAVDCIRTRPTAALLAANFEAAVVELDRP